MDPHETWRRLLEAYHERDGSLMEELAKALLVWLARGGVPPRLDGLDERSTRLVVQVFCSQALVMVPPFDV